MKFSRDEISSPRRTVTEPDLGDDLVAVSGAGLTAEEVRSRLPRQLLPPDGALADVMPTEKREGERGESTENCSEQRHVRYVVWYVKCQKHLKLMF